MIYYIFLIFGIVGSFFSACLGLYLFKLTIRITDNMLKTDKNSILKEAITYLLCIFSFLFFALSVASFFITFGVLIFNIGRGIHLWS